MKMRRGTATWVAGFLGLVLVQSAGAAVFTVAPQNPANGGFEDWPDANPGDGQCATAITFPIVTEVKCTLRAAIMEANALPGADTINITPGTAGSPNVYQLRTPTPAGTFGGAWQTETLPCAREGDLDIIDSVTIVGNAADPSTVVIDGLGQNGTLQDRIFQITSGYRACAQVPNAAPVSAANVAISGITLKGGYQPKDNFGGGAIAVDAVVYGPATGVVPIVSIKNVAFQSNFSYVTGGAITNNGGIVTVEDSTFDDSRTPYIPNIGLTTGGQGNFPGGAFIGGGQGGTIAAWSGSFTCKRCVIKGGYAQVGGAIYAQDASGTPTKVLIEDSVIQGSYAFMGAGIFSIARGDWNFGANTLNTHGVVLNRVTMETNIAEYSGGAVWQAGTMLISNSTISNNRAWDDWGNPIYVNKGGGIYNSGRVLDIRSSTIAGNEAEEVRGVNAVNSNDSAGGDEIFFDNNNATSGASTQPFRFSIQNSIIGDGPSVVPDDPSNLPGAIQDDNCNGPVGYRTLITSLGGNLDSGDTCFAPPVAAVSIRALTATDKVSTGNVFAGALASNESYSTLPGGVALKTRALAVPSAASGAGSNCPGSDGRGFARVGACDSGAYQVTVNKALAGNAVPVAQPDVVSVSTTSLVAIPVLLNDSDADAADKLTITAVSAPDRVRINAATATTPQTVTYTTPVGAAPGTDTFTYTVSDNNNATATGTVTVNVRALADNQPPVAVEDQFVIPAGAYTAIQVLANDTDPNVGDQLSVVFVSAVLPSTDATATITSDGKSVTFYSTQPATYSFTYRAQDNFTGQSNEAIVTVTVNAAPTTSDQTITVAPGGTVSGTVEGSDLEPVTFGLAIPPSQGCAVVNATTGEFQYTAIAAPSTTTKETFMVEVKDALNATANSVITVNFSGPPAASSSCVVPSSGAVPGGGSSGGGASGGGASGGGASGGGASGGGASGGGASGGGASGGGTSSGGGGSSGGAPSTPTNTTVTTGGGAIDAWWLALLAGLPIVRRVRRA